VSDNSKSLAVDLNEIKKIVELMNEHGLSHFQFEKDDYHLKLKKGTDFDELQKLTNALPVAAAAPAPVAAAAPSAALAPAAASAPADQEGEEVPSPMVGTFYRKASPEAEVFINVGDVISEGQTICIIEAMKVMNEIKAEKSGTVVAICVDDATPVQFGDPLIRIK